MTAIDLFAGLGGWTEGAEQAGLRVLWAANHSQPTVDTHQANHPHTLHKCQDLHQADWSLIPPHDVQLASPSCTGHTDARGTERPHHVTDRSTAWAVVSCAEYHRPAIICIENVIQFPQKWALFAAWKMAIEALGYAVSINYVDSADLGVPQNRLRAYIICTRSRAPFVLKLPRLEHVSVETVLQPGGHWRPVADKCDATRFRVRNGYSLGEDRFLVAYYGTAKGGRSLSRPCGTLTTRDRWALVEGDMMRFLTVQECRLIMGFPAAYILPRSSKLAKHMLGNAVCPPASLAIISALLKAA